MARECSEVAPGLFMIDAHMFGAAENLSTYVVPEPVPTLVEPGPATCHDLVLAGLDALGLDDVAQVVVTHVHLDHAGGAGTIAARFPRAEVFVHERGARHLSDPTKLVGSATRIYGEDGMARLWGEMRPVAAERLRALGEGDSIPLGGGRRLDVWYTPGHAKHHMSLVDSETGIVLVGDSVGLSFPGVEVVHPITPPPDIDVDSMIAQLHRYAALAPPALAFAHFGLRTDVAHVLEESERRLRLWASVALRLAEESPVTVGAELEAVNHADLVAHGHPAVDIERMQSRTDFATEASGLLRWVHTREPDT